MSVLKRNFVGNLIGNSWIALLNFVCIPIYIRFLGVESFGLIGFYTVLQSIFFVLDLGMGAAITREVAQSKENPEKKDNIGILVRTIEVIYWLVGILIGLIIILFAQQIVSNFLKSTISNSVLLNTVRLMGVIIIFRWPISMYMGGLLGLQRQLEFNIVQCIFETLKILGAILIFRFIKPDIIYFFEWQLFLSILTALLLFMLFWRYLPAGERRVNFGSVKSIWAFSSGVTGITLLSIVLSQMDKVVLSRLLTLETFSFYMIAYTAASALSRLSGPIAQAFYPQFVHAVSADDTVKLKQLYHKSTQLMTILIVPAALLISFFSYDILLIWTRSVQTAHASQPILSILVLGTALNCLISIPYHIQLAYGWTKLAFHQNLIAVIVLGPLLFLFTYRFGAIGAASIWLILNLGYVIFSQHVMHKKYLIKEKNIWYLNDIIKPSAVAALIILFGKYLFLNFDFQYFKIAYFISLFLIASFSALVFSGLYRKTFIPFFKTIK